VGRPEELFEDLRDRGEAAIDEFIRTRASEELYLDFKRSADEGKGVRLAQNDRANLAKAISGFGNTAGGVIVWGIDCRTDSTGADIVGQSHFPLADAAKFKSWLEGSVAGATIPSHSGVRHALVGQRSDGSGFVATLIPASDNPPHQVPADFRYLMRAGSSFTPIPHPLLASMFGRKPAPALELSVTVEPVDLSKFGLLPQILACAELSVTNRGLVSARELFVTWNTRRNPTGAALTISTFNDPRLNPVPAGVPDSGCFEMGNGWRLAPGVPLRVCKFHMTLAEPVKSELVLEITAGCSSAPPVTTTLRQSLDELGTLMTNVRLDLYKRPNATQIFGQRIAETCFGLEKE
jgi:hypothetical protein